MVFPLFSSVPTTWRRLPVASMFSGGLLGKVFEVSAPWYAPWSRSYKCRWCGVTMTTRRGALAHIMRGPCQQKGKES